MQNLKKETEEICEKKLEISKSIDLEKQPEKLRITALDILADIDKYCEDAYNDGFRSHLGASMIGRECSRELWYSFRWCKSSSFSGRMMRLFNRGHREEERFIEWLEGIGCQVWADDLENNALLYNTRLQDYRTVSNSKLAEMKNDECDVSMFANHIKIAKAMGVKFPQYRVSGAEGHFGGSMDGFVKLPERYGIDELLLLEFKTNGTGAAFNKLKETGMKLNKKEHFAQTCTYGSKGVMHEGKHIKFKHVLYLNINKNDDSIYGEIVKLDHRHGEQLELKAEKIILSQSPPPRLSDNPTYMKCGWCDYKEICHENKPVEKNCRSCKFAQAAQGSEWFCNKFQGNLPKEFIVKGCDEHSSINVNNF